MLGAGVAVGAGDVVGFAVDLLGADVEDVGAGGAVLLGDVLDERGRAAVEEVDGCVVALAVVNGRVRRVALPVGVPVAGVPARAPGVT